MRILSALASLVWLVGCGDDRELREWRADDHSQPPREFVDPARVPSQDVAEQLGTPEERAAAQLWLMRCALCHGQNGRGDGPSLPPMARAPDMTNADWQSSRTDEQLLEGIEHGRPPMMPSFGENAPTSQRIRREGIVALVQHVRGLGQPADASN